MLDGSTGNDLLDGGAGNDVLDGGASDDVLLGGDGDDDLDGHFNDDTLDGGAGNDTLYGGFNNDVLFGGDGNDFLDGGFNDDVLDGGLGNDTLFGGNNYDVLFGGDGDDILDGGSNNDTLYGGDGNDFIDGGSGYDVIHSGLGNDTIVGGNGYDTLTFTNATSGVDVDLSLGTIAGDGFGGFDTVSEIEIVIGSDYNDLIVGDVGNTLDGGLGNDTLIGSDGDDVLIGGDDDDSLSGASGTDSLDGGAGNDEIDIGRLNFIEGGLGDDTFNLEFEYDAAIISDVGGSDTLLLETAADGLLTVDPTSFLMFIEDGILSVDTDDEDVHGILVDNFLTTGAIESFEFESVGITPFLFATAGTSGNDLLIGVEDTLTLAGGEGNDVIHAGDSEVVNLTGNGGNDFLIGSEDFFTTLDGGTGDDVLRSLGGIGNDTLIAGGSNITLDGGADDDIYVFDFSDGSINATISDGSGTDTLLLNSGIDFPSFISPGVTDLFFGFSEPSGGSSFIQVINQTTNGIEFITADLGDGNATTFEIQSGTTGTTGNDILVGSPFANETLTGDDGADILFGNGGTDTILGGAGNDFIQGGADNDFINGGADIDTFDISNATSAVVVDLTDTFAQTLGGGLGVDTLTSIENVRGSSFTDTIIGSSDDNTIDGGDGDDLISGGDGNDTFVFGSFDGDGIVHFDDFAGSNDTLILGTTGEDTLAIDFEFFKSGNDLQIDFIAGGNPTGEQAFVTDQFLGPKIVENFVFSENSGVTYVAQDSATSGNDLIVAANSSVDTTITGGDGADALFGGIANDLLQGDGGNDALVGSDGNDVLKGGAGNDDLVGGAGNDVMDGGLGDDFFTVGEGDDTILDSGGVDSVEMALNVGLSSAERVGNDLLLTLSSGATASIDNHFAGQAIEFVEEGFDQSIFLVSTGTDGTIAEDLIAGGSSNDTLSGFADHDHLFGNDGDDILIGGGERDLLEGGAGNDIFRFLDPSDGATLADGESIEPFFDGDFIADFITGVDKFQLDAAAFGFGSPTSLILGTNFFFQSGFTGTLSPAETPSGAYIVFDTSSFTLIADESQGVDGYTVVADVGTSVAITDVELI